MEYCSGSDLSIYIKKRGKIPSLEYLPRGSVDGQKVFWPHPESGGLDERVTRHFLGQLGELRASYRTPELTDSHRPSIPAGSEPDPSGYQTSGQL
jgi:serine/threonine-protein kinase ULK/ATG1